MKGRVRTTHGTEMPNAAGELAGLGPAWVCGNYAKTGHDYNSCTQCYSNYETRYLPRILGDRP